MDKIFEMRKILKRKKELLSEMSSLEKTDPSVRDFLRLRKESEHVLDFLLREEEYTRLSIRENELLGINVPEEPTIPAKCEHPIKLMIKQKPKTFDCICLECGKLVTVKSTNTPIKNGILYAQEPEDIDLEALKEEIKSHPNIISLQGRINQGEFNRERTNKR